MKPIRFDRKEKSEREIKKEITDYLTLKGWLVVQVRNTGTFNKKSGGFIPAHQLGVSDLICCNPEGGQFYALEIKRPGGILSNWQVEFLIQVRHANGRTLVAYSLDDVIKAVSEIENDRYVKERHEFDYIDRKNPRVEITVE